MKGEPRKQMSVFLLVTALIVLSLSFTAYRARKNNEKIIEAEKQEAYSEAFDDGYSAGYSDRDSELYGAGNGDELNPQICDILNGIEVEYAMDAVEYLQGTIDYEEEISETEFYKATAYLREFINSIREAKDLLE